MGIDQQQFRRALSHFATGVTVITVVRSPGEVHGMTANAFSSVSLQPPLVLVCVAHSARTRPLLQERKRFGVNVLHEGQQAIARYYADVEQDHGTAADLGVRYSYTERGTPLLEPSLAQLECALVTTYEAGDHTIFIGEVEQAKAGKGQPLIFYGGQYCRLETDSA